MVMTGLHTSGRKADSCPESDGQEDRCGGVVEDGLGQRQVRQVSRHLWRLRVFLQLLAVACYYAWKGVVGICYVGKLSRIKTRWVVVWGWKTVDPFLRAWMSC